jgi:hypothetical protein
MNYSESHKDFATLLTDYHNINYQDVLEHPEDYLGPNYKELLNFWFYWDSLSDDQQYSIVRYHHIYIEARELAEKLASEVIDPRFIEYFWDEEWEIIASHLYIERSIPFTFIPLIFDL